MAICKSATGKTVVVMVTVLESKSKSVMVAVTLAVLVMTMPVIGAVARRVKTALSPAARCNPVQSRAGAPPHVQSAGVSTENPLSSEGSVSVSVNVSVVRVVNCSRQPRICPLSE